MDINSLFKILQGMGPQVASSYCIVNGNIMKLDEVQAMGYDDFSLQAKIHMPAKLYKYFPNRPTEQIDQKSGISIVDEKNRQA